MFSQPVPMQHSSGANLYGMARKLKVSRDTACSSPGCRPNRAGVSAIAGNAPMNVNVSGHNLESAPMLQATDRALRADRRDRSAAEGSSVAIRSVSKSFTTRKSVVHALSSVDLDIRKGEFVSIIGPSGCGK